MFHGYLRSEFVAFNSSADFNLAEVKIYIQVHYVPAELEASYEFNKR